MRQEAVLKYLHTRPIVLFVVGALAVLAASCGGSSSTPTSPSASVPPLPVMQESADFRFHYAAGDSVDAAWEQQYHAWATATLGVQMPQKIDYYKYQSREDMGAHTGHYNTNGYANPATFEIHTLWSTDNHEVVHIYSALIGRPSDFFNEGLAVALQTNPATGDFVPRFNGEAVHEAAKRYRQSGTLVLPLAGIVTTSGFRNIADSTLSYREAGSFVAFLLDHYGMSSVQQFFRTSSAGDGLETIRTRFLQAFGQSLEQAEAAWLAFVG